MTSVELHFGRHLDKTNGRPFDIAPYLNPASAMHFLAVSIHRTARTRSLPTNISNPHMPLVKKNLVLDKSVLVHRCSQLDKFNAVAMGVACFNLCEYWMRLFFPTCVGNYPRQMEVNCMFSSSCSCLHAWRPGRLACCVSEYNMHQRPLHTSVFIMHTSVCNDLLLPLCDYRDHLSS